MKSNSWLYSGGRATGNDFTRVYLEDAAATLGQQVG